MDPISIITLAGSATSGAYSISKALYEFINGVKEVDETVRSLASEMSGLRRALDAVSAVLANPLIKTDKAVAPENAPIWAACAMSLEECRKSLVTFQKKIIPPEKETRNSLLRRSVTTIKLKLAKDDIAGIRNQVITHTSSIQLALQMLNLLLAGIGPVTAVEGISGEVSRLSDTLKQLELNQSSESTAFLAEIEGTARDVLNRAPEFVTTGLLESADEPVRNKAIEALRKTVSEYNRSIQATYQANSAPGADSSGSRLVTTSNDEDDSDSDEDIELALAQDFFKRANERFDQKAWEDAEAYFRDGLRHVASLAKVDDSLDVQTARLRLAISVFQRDKFEEAELMLLVLTKGTTAITAQLLEAYYHLSQVYLCLYDFESALEYAAMAAKGRRRLLGKTDPKTSASTKLQALVYEANGDFVTAQAYRNKASADLQRTEVHPFIQERFTGFLEVEHLRLTIKEKQQALTELEQADIVTRGRYEEPPVVERNGRLVTLKFQYGVDSLNLRKALIWAAANNKLLLVKWLIARGAVPSEGPKGGAPLCEAAEAGHIEVQRLLLRSGADPNSGSGYGSVRTPLYYASYKGRETCVRELLAAGADQQVIDGDGETAIMTAAREGHTAVLKLLIEKDPSTLNWKGAVMRKNALYQAMFDSRIESAEYLLKQGADPMAKSVDKSTPFSEALERRLHQLIPSLLAAGAKPEPRHLTKAVVTGELSSVKAILDHGVNPNGPGDNSFTPPLYGAASAKTLKIARLLLEYGADRNYKGDQDIFYGAKLKHEADTWSNDTLIDFLKEMGGGFLDCRDEGKNCKICPRWDKKLDLKPSKS